MNHGFIVTLDPDEVQKRKQTLPPEERSQVKESIRLLAFQGSQHSVSWFDFRRVALQLFATEVALLSFKTVQADDPAPGDVWVQWKGMPGSGPDSRRLQYKLGAEEDWHAVV